MAHPSLRPVLDAADRGEDPAVILRSALSLVEQTAHDVARLTRGVTTATPERRKLREAFEIALSDFIAGTASHENAVTYTMPEASLLRILAQSPAAQPAAESEERGHE